MNRLWAMGSQGSVDETNRPSQVIILVPKKTAEAPKTSISDPCRGIKNANPECGPYFPPRFMVSFISTSCAPPSEIVMGETRVRRALSRISGMDRGGS